MKTWPIDIRPALYLLGLLTLILLCILGYMIVISLQRGRPMKEKIDEEEANKRACEIWEKQINNWN